MFYLRQSGRSYLKITPVAFYHFSLIMIFFRICFKPWTLLRQANESRINLSTLFSFWSTHLAIFCASIFQNSGMRSYPFSQPSAFNSLSFLSSLISSSFYHHLSFPDMIKLVTPVGNWGIVWIHSDALLFPYVLHCWRALALLPQALQDQFQFSFGSMKNTSAHLFFSN